MPAPLDPRMLVAYPLDEPGASDVRKSVAPLAHPLTPHNSTGTQGVPAVNDDIAGRALNLLATQTGLTVAGRSVRGVAAAWNVHPLYIALPRSTGSTGYAYGCRFSFGNVGASITQNLFWMGEAGVAYGHFGFLLVTGAAAGGVIRGRLHIVPPSRVPESITGAGWTDTDGLAAALTADYIQRNEWWRAACRIANVAGTSHILQVVLFRESTGARYRLTRTALVADYADPTTSVRLNVGASSSTTDGFQGRVDDCWLLNGDLAEEAAVDIVRLGIKMPREEDNTYRGLPKVIVRALFNEGGEEFETRPVFVSDSLLARVGARAGSEAFSIRVEGYAPGRPGVIKWLSALYIQKAGSRGSVR